MGFDEIVGQETAKRVLTNSLREARLASSYLFYGPKGVGKATAAFALAKAVNCREREADYCDKCSPCKRIENLSHPNVRVLFPLAPKVSAESLRWSLKEGRPDFGQKGSISIDTIRGLRKEISLKPFEKGRRVIIILDADRMTTEAANAFLKSLEEPPLDSTFVLTTARRASLLPTVVSRCQSVPFRSLGRQEIEDALLKRADIQADLARLLSLVSGGSMGKALELSKEGGGSRREWLLELISHPPAERWGISREGEVKKNSEEYIQSLTLLYRDLLFLKELGEEAVVNVDLLPVLREKAGEISVEEVKNSIDKLMDASSALGRNVNPELVWADILSQLA